MGTGGVKNPSAWMAKSCIGSGANPNQDSQFEQQVPGVSRPMTATGLQQQPTTTMEIDERASNLLHSLPYETQMDITRKLEAIRGQVMNPSAWVAKACLKAQQSHSPGQN